MEKIYQKELDDKNMKLYNITSDLYGKLMNDNSKLKKFFKKWKHFDWELPTDEGWYICMVFDKEELIELPLYFLPSEDEPDGPGSWFRSDADDSEEYYNYNEKDQPWYSRRMMFMWRLLPNKWDMTMEEFIFKYMDELTTINF